MSDNVGELDDVMIDLWSDPLRRVSRELEIFRRHSPGRNTPIEYVQLVRNDLVEYLDLATGSMQEWKMIGQEMGLTTGQILHIGELKGAAAEFLDKCRSQGKSVEDLIRAVSAVKHMRALELLLRAYPNIIATFDRDEEKKQESYRSEPDATSERTDTFHAQEQQLQQLQQQQLQQLQLQQQQLQQLQLQQQQLQQQQLQVQRQQLQLQPVNESRDSAAARAGSRLQQSSAAGNQVVSLQKAVSMISNLNKDPYDKSGNRRLRVFLTFKCDPKDVELMIQINIIITMLAKRHYNVRHLECPSHQKIQNKMRWLESEFTEADKVLVLYTSDYARDVIRNSTHDVTEQVSSARYINRLITNEYYNNGGINKRFIPVVMETGPDALPDWMQTTFLYYWPDCREHLVERLREERDALNPSISRRKKPNSGQSTSITFYRS